MDELLLKLYEKHPFIQDNGARSLVTDKLVAKEFYKIGYNKAIDEFEKAIIERLHECIETFRLLDRNDIREIAEQMKGGATYE